MSARPLAAFGGQDPNGDWQLAIHDNENYAGGSLDGWSLRLCTYTQSSPAPTGSEKAFTLYAYDGGAVGDAPTQSNPTLVHRYSQVTPSAAYVDTTTAFDSLGRPTTVTDANNHSATTAQPQRNHSL